jgi:ATP-dependent RNA helicase DeaD
MEVTTRLIDFYGLKLMLIFCNQKKRVDEVVEELVLRGYSAEGLHGDLRQTQRTQVMNRFRSGAVSILVATDVAARGLDVENVDAVINYDIPLDEEYYVHRIGRTGRAGKFGKAFTMVVGSERNRLREIMNYTKVKIDKGVIPSFSDVVGVKKGMFIERISSTIQAGDLEMFDDVLQSLQHAGHSTEQVVSALVKMNMGVQKNEFADENLDGELERQSRKFGREERGGGFRGERDDRNARRGSGRFERESSGGRFGDRDRGGRDRDGNRSRASLSAASGRRSVSVPPRSEAGTCAVETPQEAGSLCGRDD